MEVTREMLLMVTVELVVVLVAVAAVTSTEAKATIAVEDMRWWVGQVNLQMYWFTALHHKITSRKPQRR
jgi:uncharacterized protein (DUF2141 family)